MIETIVGPSPDTITDEQVAFMDREEFLTFGKVLTDEEIIEGRFAYARVWEQNPLSAEQLKGDGIPGHPSLTMESFLHEPALARLVGNDYGLKIASAVLRTPVEDLIYVAGYIHRQRLFARWDYDQWFWDGWHLDGVATLDPLIHCNIWYYFNDCTRAEGVTEALVGGCELQRENLRAGKDINKDRFEEGGVQDGILGLIEELKKDPSKGTWAEAPAGGGLAWGGFLWHRIAPNRSGINRQLITYEYAPRDKPHKPDFMDKTTPEQRQAIKEHLPAEKRYLVEY